MGMTRTGPGGGDAAFLGHSGTNGAEEAIEAGGCALAAPVEVGAGLTSHDTKTAAAAVPPANAAKIIRINRTLVIRAGNVCSALSMM